MTQHEEADAVAAGAGARPGPAPVADPGGVAARRLHVAARRHHRQRRGPLDPRRAGDVHRGGAVGGVRLRTGLRHDAGRRRAPRRRARSSPDDDDRAARLHRLQRRRGARAQRGGDRGRPPGPGRQRRAADPAELRADPAAVPRGRAGPGLRDVRLHGRGGLGGRPLIGGLLIGALGEENGWRALFLVNVPIGLVALVLVRRLVPDNPGGRGGDRDTRVDVPGRCSSASRSCRCSTRSSASRAVPAGRC